MVPEWIQNENGPQGESFSSANRNYHAKKKTSMTIISMSRHLIMIEYLEDQWFLTGVKMMMDPLGNQFLVPIEVTIPKIRSLGPL